MLRKEFLDTFRQTLLVLVFLAVIPLVYVVDRVLYNVVKFPWYVVNGFGLLTIILGLYLALGFFHRERRENAGEYLYSLPIPRWKLFWSKFLPRLIVMGVFVWINQLMIQWNWTSRDSLDLHPLNKGLMVNFIGAATLLFFGYIVCVLGRKAWRSASMLFVILAGIWSTAFTRIPAHRLVWITTMRSTWLHSVWADHTSSFVNQNIAYLEWLLLMAFVALAFIPVLRRIDFVPSRVDENRFLRLAWIPFLLVALTIIGRSTGLAAHVRTITAEWLKPVWW